MKFKELTDYLRYMWVILRPEKFLVTMIILSIIAHAVLTVGVPMLTMILIDNALKIYENGLLWWVILGMVFIPTTSGVLMTFEDYFANKLGHKVLTNMRVKLFSNVLNRKVESHSKALSGEYLQTIIDEPEEIGHWIYITSIQILLNCMSLVILLSVLFYLSIGLGLMTMFLLLFYIIPYILFKNKLQKASFVELESRAAATGILNEGLNAVKLFKSFGNVDFLQKRLEKVNEENFRAFMAVKKIDRKNNLYIGSIMSLGIALIYLYGGLQVIEGTLTIGVMIAAKMYIEQIFLRSQVIYYRLMETFQKMPIAKKLEKESHDESNYEVSGDKDLNNIESISLRNIYFSYDEQEIFKNLTLDIKMNKYTSIVGRSGCGKSSLLKMLFKLIDTNKGDILINNSPIQHFRLEKLRSIIQFVPQNSEFVSGSIWENLIFGIDEIEENEVKELLRLLRINEFVEKLPHGYDTVIGSNDNVTLSGGQLQRLAIARALIRKPKVLLLDEVTSGLDSENAINVQTVLKGLEEVTIISVTHNLEEAKHSDYVINLDQNKVSECNVANQLVLSSIES
ncbi:ABC transporter ATP-binding protein [Bacillus cereus group sp. MYBK227-1]|uniref:ABC transporter ATP-binding protein n=1 Tax=Bacillus cereus group sp. MYBK227-1 TaxID=3450654 RepID=UPI003F79E45A